VRTRAIGALGAVALALLQAMMAASPAAAVPLPGARAPRPAPAPEEPGVDREVPHAAEPPPDDWLRPRAEHEGWRERLLLLPFIGLNWFLGDGADNLKPGLRIGSFVGARLGEHWSANGQAAIDVVNLSPPDGVSASEYIGDVTFSPLAHIRPDKVELIVGPSAGVWYLGSHASGQGVTADEWAWGFTFGANLGVFAPVNDRVSLGGLFSFTYRSPFKVCLTVSSAGEACQTNGLGAIKVLAFTAAVMF
jgi:hypothetical protein